MRVKSNAWLRKGILLAYLFSILFLIISQGHVHSSMNLKSNSSVHHSSSQSIPRIETKRDATNGEGISDNNGGGSDVELFLERGFDGIVTIATGSFSAMRLVSALRDIGEFERPIFILTDKVNSTMQELDRFNVTLVDITHHKPSFNSTQAAEAWENTHITKVKWFKTQLFSLIPPPANNEKRRIWKSNDVLKEESKNNSTAASTTTTTSAIDFERTSSSIDNLLYIDADEIINSPIVKFETAVKQSIISNNNAPFQWPLSSSRSQPCSAYFFPERLYISQSVNSGTALYFRNVSERFLSEWNRDIISGAYDRDQIALDATLRRNTDLRVCTFPSRYNFFSADFVTLVWNFLSLGRRRKGATFIHPCSTKDTSQMATPYDRTKVSNHRL
mmetsp:Transcript_7545/g.11415  ORF Transcript_7545/g.11415 Transcript_7545/m.11415 type:complete len:389 (-) Transcript_7545:37-1203(-)